MCWPARWHKIEKTVQVLNGNLNIYQHLAQFFVFYFRPLALHLQLVQLILKIVNLFLPWFSGSLILDSIQLLPDIHSLLLQSFNFDFVSLSQLLKRFSCRTLSFELLYDLICVVYTCHLL